MSSLHIIICLSSPSLFLFSFLTEDIFHPIKKFSFVSVLLSIIQDYLAKKLLVYIFNLYFLAAATAAVKSLQSCPTLCDPIDGSPPGSPVPGILQARVLEWVAIAFSIYLVSVFSKVTQCQKSPIEISIYAQDMISFL